MQLVDTHCHLNFEPMRSDLSGVLLRAGQAGVSKIILPAYDSDSWEAIEKLAEHPQICPAFGLHPWVADQHLDIVLLREFLVKTNAVAIGEIGLDFKIDGFDRKRQLQVFQAQLQLAVELDLPVILHARGGFDEMLDTLHSYTPHLRGVLHAFSRSPALAKRFLDVGMHLGLGGAITRSRATRARKVAATAPLERIVLETDAPSIGLENVPPDQTEPHHISDICCSLAELRGMETDDVARKTTENATRLFQLD